MDQAALFSPSSPQVTVLPKASLLSSPTQLTRRLPRTRSRSQLSSAASLESIVEESFNDNFEHSVSHAKSNPTPDFSGEKERNRLTVSRPSGWNGKKGITTGRGMRNVCGICFESAVKPNKSRCCGQLFCFQHLSDWLSASGSDGRCPTCRVPLSLEADTICLHPPAKPKPSAVSFLLPPIPPKRRSISGLRSRRFVIGPRYSASSSSSNSSQEQDSDVGSSTSESEDVPRRSGALSMRPKYESISDMVSDLVPLWAFGSLLSLIGTALVVGTILS
jgi:hypothetical protein